MSSIRAKQQMEMLDVWKNINAQVVARTGKQIAVFPDTIAPKTQRDVGAEVNVDKAVEQFNKVVEQKLGVLEYLIQHITDEDADISSRANKPFATAQSESENTGEIVPIWNSIVRAYQQPSLSKDSQSAIHVKVQELIPNLNAIKFGIMNVIDHLFDILEQDPERASKYTGGFIMNLLRSYSVYKYIAKSVEATNFQILTVPLLDTEFKNAFEDLSQERVEILKHIAPSAKDILRSTVRNIPDFPVNDFNARVKALEDELGFNLPPADLVRMRKLNKSEQLTALAEVKDGYANVKQHFTKEEENLIRMAEHLEGRVESTRKQLSALREEYNAKLAEVTALEEGRHLDEEDALDHYLEVPEVPEEPQRPHYRDYDNEFDFLSALERFPAEYEEYERLAQEAQNAIYHNQFIDTIMIRDKTDRQQRIDSLMAEMELLDAEEPNIERELAHLRQEKDDFIAEHQISEQTYTRRRVPKTTRNRYGISIIKDKRESALKPVKEAERLQRVLSLILHKNKRRTVTDVREDVEQEERDEAYRKLVEDEGEREESDEGEFSESDRSESEVEEREVGVGRPYRNRLDTRGLASMRSNFGVKNRKVYKDMYDFDDRRNEHYYVKPAK